MKKKVTIIDIECGNILSIKRAFEKWDAEVDITTKKEKILSASRLVLPGVGAFRNAIDKLKSRHFFELIPTIKLREIPLLGICLGMQLLATEGYENNKHTKGLDLIQGKVIKLDSKGFKLPHIGWNNAEFLFETPLNKNIQNKSDFYFVHSWVFECNKKENIVSTTNYGSRFTSTIGQNYIYGTQFHPEKSLEMGLKLLQNFLNINA